VVNIKLGSKTIENIELAIFDKDGTLMDLYNYWMNMIDLRVGLAQKKLGFNKDGKKKIMYAMGVDLDKGRLRPEGPVGLLPREVVMQAMIDCLAELGYKDKKDLCIETFKEADKISVDLFPKIIRPLNGMTELINGLNKGGCKIAIATTDKTERAKIAMKFLGIADKIDIIVGADIVRRSKPDPEMINLIIKKAGIPKERTIMVGDAITDVQMGINAGVAASIGVGSGLTPKEELLKTSECFVEDISRISVV